MEKVMIMRVTQEGKIEIKSMTSYRETPLHITALKGYRQRIKKSEMEYVRGVTGYYQYELISRKMTYVEMKREMVQYAIRGHLSEIERSQKALSELAKLI